MAAADAFAAKGASDIDAGQMQATLRSLVADALKNSTAQSTSSPPANAQQAMLRYALARHGQRIICNSAVATAVQIGFNVDMRPPEIAVGSDWLLWEAASWLMLYASVNRMVCLHSLAEACQCEDSS